MTTTSTKVAPTRASAVRPSAVAAAAGPAGAAVAGKRKRKLRTSHERVVVTGLIAFGFAAAVLGSVRVAGDVRATRAKELMHGTFTRVDQQQDDFRRINARYATWPELSARGVRLPGRQQLRNSSADQSHWYLSLRDRNTGVVCDQVGALFDEPGSPRRPVCRVPEADADPGTAFAGRTDRPKARGGYAD